MKDVDTDKIIGAGLIAALLLKIFGDMIIILLGFDVPAGDLATNIVACLAGYMGRSLLEKIRHGGYSDDGLQSRKTDTNSTEQNRQNHGDGN